MQLKAWVFRRQLQLERRLLDQGLRLRPESGQAVNEGAGDDEIHGPLP
jgi:hypothetical protein